MAGTKKIYAIFGGVSPGDLDKRVSETFTDGFRRQLGAGDWLVADDAESPSVFFEKLGKAGTPIDCVIIPVTQYYGWKDKAVWEWIETVSK